MEKARRGEIALAMLKYKWSREGIKIGPNSKRDMGNIAKETGISIDEFKEFLEALMKEFIEETFQ